MRGVIHILEIVTTGIMLLGSIAYFFGIPETTIDWSAPHFSTKTSDFFLAIENNGSIGTAIFDETEFVSLYSEYVSPMNFEISVNGPVEPLIRAACNCTLEEIHFLRDWLTPVNFNGRNVSFFLRRSNLADLGNDDIIIIYGTYIIVNFPHAAGFDLNPLIKYHKFEPTGNFSGGKTHGKKSIEKICGQQTHIRGGVSRR